MKNRFSTNIILSLLLVLFLAQGGIGYLILQCKLISIKEEMKSLVLSTAHEDSLTPMHFSVEEYKNVSWPEAWEFEYQGKMYDLSKKEIHSDGSITLYALIDDEENDLNALVESLVQQSSDKKQTQEQLNFFFKLQSQWVCDFNVVEIPISESRSIRLASNRFFVSSPHVRLNELPPNC